MDVCNLMTKIIPDSTILSQKGGSLTFMVKSDDLKEIIKDPYRSEILKLLQKERLSLKFKNKDVEELSKLIINFGISQSTLEEVFTIVNKSTQEL